MQPADVARDAILAIIGDEPEMNEPDTPWWVAAARVCDRIKREREQAENALGGHICPAPPPADRLMSLKEWRQLVRSEYARRNASEKGFTAQAFAAELGISYSTLYRILNPKKRGGGDVED
jgi:DNA invertase Pin-like site-specific DNA recombinase